MSNTIIQIRRSSASTTPTGLANGEMAYTYTDGKLHIGRAGVADVIGGTFYTSTHPLIWATANGAYATANAAYNAANSAPAAAGFDQANAAYLQANAAYNAANTKLSATGGTVSGDLVITGNLTTTGVTTYANTTHLDIGDNILTLNSDLPDATAPSENSGIEVNRGSAANVFFIWNEANDKWTFTVDGSGYFEVPTNTAVETVTVTASAAFGVANGAVISAGAAFDKANTANVNAANATFLSTGTVPSARITGSYTGITGVGTLVAGTWNASTITVPYGGTGGTTFTTSGVLYGAGTGAIQATAAGTEGKVLQANASGVPVFGDLDGGTF